jgi:hypothetical protein
MRRLTMRRSAALRVLALVTLGPLAILPVRAEEKAEAPGDTLEALRECMRQNFPQHSSVQVVELQVRDRGGSIQDLKTKIWWQRFKTNRSRVLIRVTAPEDVRGSAVLMKERDDGADIFLYSPELRKTRRISSRSLAGSLFGSDFTYEDFRNILGLATAGEVKRLASRVVDGREVHVLEQNPSPESGSQYQRVLTYVTREGCIPVKSEMFEASGSLRKVMTASVDDLIEKGGAKIPRRLLMEDVLGGTSSVLEITSLKVNVRIKRKIFDLSSLERSSSN